MKTAAFVQTLNLIQALLNWLAARSAHRAEVITLLEEKHAAGEDVTTADVLTRLDIVADELDETAELIDQSGEPE